MWGILITLLGALGLFYVTVTSVASDNYRCRSRECAKMCMNAKEPVECRVMCVDNNVPGCSKEGG